MSLDLKPSFNKDQPLKLCIKSTWGWLIPPTKDYSCQVLNRVGKASDTQIPLSDICICKVNDEKGRTVSLDGYKDLNTLLYLPEFSYHRLAKREHPFCDIVCSQF